MLELKDIKKSYHSHPVLQKTSLQLENGIYWIKGPNGSGKTTLLKIVAGLIPFEGDILFKNISQKERPVSYRQNISWAEAEPLYPGFIAARDLIFLYKDLRRGSQMEIDKLVELFQLNNYLNDAIGTLSAGMVKKLCLLLAFIGETGLCILDEPLITLDAYSLEAVSRYILERNKKKGTMFLITSHQDISNDLMSCAKQVVIENRTIFLSE